jgi:hypothetical protein
VRARRLSIGFAGGALLLTACGDGSETDADADAGVVVTTVAPNVLPADRCLVRLHGKSETGAPARLDDDVAILSPTGNDVAGPGHQWLYDDEADYAAAREIVVDAVDGCGRIILNGFSNGAAFAAKLYCSGEDFAGRLVRVVIDDPVVDEGVLDCQPADDVDVVLYWTGELEPIARPGQDCDEIGWTCDGGVTIGIDAYADALRTDVLDSAHDTHVQFTDAPELSDWT